MPSIDAFLSLSGTIWMLWMAALGACIGSFANVLALQWPKRLKLQWNRDVADYLERTPESLGLDATPDKAWLMRRSHCPHCGTPLGWWQLVPLFSYLMLRGRCHHCHETISVRYPLVEAGTAGLFALVALQHPPGLTALVQIFLLTVLVVLSLIDLDEMLLPDDLTLPLLWLGLLHSAALQPDQLESRVIGAMAGYLSLWSVYHVFRLATGREGMGYGDFKLMAALGAWLGWPALLPIALAASLAGSIWGISLILLRRADRQQPIPFGPWLAMGGALEILQINPLGAWLRSLA